MLYYAGIDEEHTEEIMRTAVEAAPDPRWAAFDLMVAANRGGGGDNISCIVVEVDAVGEPGVAAKPATVLKVVKRVHPKLRNTEIVFVLSLAKMCVQSNAQSGGKLGRFAHQILRD